MKHDAINRLAKHPAFLEIHPTASPDDLDVIYDTSSESLVYNGQEDAAWLWRKADGWAPVYLDQDNLNEGSSFFEDNPGQFEKMFSFLWDDTSFTVYRDRAAIFVA